MSHPGILDRPESEAFQPAGKGDRGWIVTVFDNDINTVEEVIQILLIATACDIQEAEIETWEIHNLGKSVVHVSDQNECQQVAAVIAQIGIDVRVSKD